MDGELGTKVTTLQTLLDPRRFENMSPQMAAIMGYLLDQPFTTPALSEILVTPDGAVLTWS